MDRRGNRETGGREVTDNDEARIQAILQIRLDVAETWDCIAFAVEKITAKESPWEPTAKAEIHRYIAEADRGIAASAHDPATTTARHLAMRRNLYARAVQA